MIIFIALTYIGLFTSRWTLATSFQLETFERETGGDQVSPNQVETIGVPVSLRYFDTSGFFAGVRATYVHQDVSRPGASELEGDESFAVVDASLGYRIPKRWGIATVGIANLLDTKFRFQDANFRTSETRPPEFIPERTIFARLVLSF
jgi:outer membrane receptor protein involved in Fe transport